MVHGSDVVRELRCMGVPNAENSVPDNPSLGRELAPFSAA